MAQFNAKGAQVAIRANCVNGTNGTTHTKGYNTNGTTHTKGYNTKGHNSVHYGTSLNKNSTWMLVCNSMLDTQWVYTKNINI
jgi:hypothetical protein